MTEKKELNTTWDILNSNIKTLKNRIREQGKIKADLRKELEKAQQIEANTGWVEHDGKSL